MNKTTIIESKNVNKNIHQVNYKVGNSVFVVKSCFAGKEKLEDLIFDIIKSKKVGNSAENSVRA